MLQAIDTIVYYVCQTSFRRWFRLSSFLSAVSG